MAGSWIQLIALVKAAVRAHKYIRREPKPGGGWHYYYSEAATARQVDVGHRVRIGAHTHDVVRADRSGLVALRHTETGKEELLHASELHQRLHSAYRDAYARGAQRVARRLLKQVKGIGAKTIEADPMKAWRQLGDRFRAAGVPREQALSLLRVLGKAKGWGGNAKAVMVALAADKQLGKSVTGSRTQIMRGAANLARAEQKRLDLDEPFTLAPVQPKHVVMAAQSRLPEGGGSAAEKSEQLLRDAAGELGKLEAMLTALEAVGPQAPEALKSYADAALKSRALAELSVAADAYPGLAASKEVRQLRELEGRHHALTADHGRKKSDKGRGIPGAETTVYVADVSGTPTPQRARYRLVEVGDVHASHDAAKDFRPSRQYPKGLQERAYHRDEAEQQKVRRNAQRLRPDLVINTNPDAANGPPIMTADGIVLGGNSRTMSLELAHAKGGAASKAYVDHLKRNATTFGLTPAEIDSMRAPVLVREVEAPKEDHATLVRRYNEAFTQSMDPRTDQVARARLVSDDMLQTLARGMVTERGEQKHNTLNAYLDSSDGRAFIGAMERSGIIDARNRSQYMRPTKKGQKAALNEDGKRLVQRLLVGRLVPDADTLGDVTTQQMRALSMSMPHIVRAQAAGHDVTPALREALQAHRYMRLARMKSPKDFDRAPELGESGRAAGSGMPTRPKLSAAGRHVLDVMHAKPGHIAHSGWWREFAAHAEKNPAGQAGLFGAGKTTEALLEEVRRGQHKTEKKPMARAERDAREAQAEEERAEVAARAEAGRAQTGLFASLSFVDLVKAVQLGMFGRPAVGVSSGAQAKPGHQLGLFGDEPKPKTKKKSRVVFRGPKGGIYLDPAHTVTAKHDNPHGDKLRSGSIIRGPGGHLHEVRHVGAHHKTGKVHALVETPKGPQVFQASRVQIHRHGREAGQAKLFASLGDAGDLVKASAKPKKGGQDPLKVKLATRFPRVNVEDAHAFVDAARKVGIRGRTKRDQAEILYSQFARARSLVSNRSDLHVGDRQVVRWAMSGKPKSDLDMFREPKAKPKTEGAYIAPAMLEYLHQQGGRVPVPLTGGMGTEGAWAKEHAKSIDAAVSAGLMEQWESGGSRWHTLTDKGRAKFREMQGAKSEAARRVMAVKPKKKPRDIVERKHDVDRPQGLLGDVMVLLDKHQGDVHKVRSDLAKKHPEYTKSPAGAEDILLTRREWVKDYPEYRTEKEPTFAKPKAPDSTHKKKREAVKPKGKPAAHDIMDHPPAHIDQEQEVSRWDRVDLAKELQVQFPKADRAEIDAFVGAALDRDLKVRSARAENKMDLHPYDKAEHYLRAFARAHSLVEAARRDRITIHPAEARVVDWALSGKPVSALGIKARVDTKHPVDRLPQHHKRSDTPVRPSGSGWHPIPKGRHGGWRKRVGNRWRHWYPTTGAATAAAEHHAQLAQGKRQEARMLAGKKGVTEKLVAEDAAKRHSAAASGAREHLRQRAEQAEPKKPKKPQQLLLLSFGDVVDMVKAALCA